jgi:hypothetical protein
MQTITQSEATAAKRRIRFILELAVARNEVQTVFLGDASTADTFTLSMPAYAAFSLETTGTITWNANTTTLAGNIKTALDALTSVGAVTCAYAGVANTFTVTFDTGNGSATDVPLMTLAVLAGSFTQAQTLITQTTNGGPIGWPAKTETLTVATMIVVEKNGGAQAAGAGTVTIVGNGSYYYEATAAEVDTLGYLGLTILNNAAINTVYPTVEIISATTEQGFYSFTAAAGDTNSITLPGSASGTNNTYANTLVVITSGPGSEEGAKYAWAYNGTTKVLSTEPAYITPPTSDSVVELRHISPCLFELIRANHIIEDTIGGEMATVTDVADQVESQIIDGGTPIIVGQNGGVTLEPRRGTA